MKQKKKSKFDAIKEFYSLYTSGLSRGEIERLLKHESVDVWSYYKKGASRVAPSTDNFPKKQLLVTREFFISFILKLTPARRLFFGIAFVLFLFAFLVSNWYYAFFAFLIVNLLLAFELADKMVAKDELDIARSIQIGLQPEKNPQIDGLEIASFFQPAKEVGGDYYDLVKLDENRIALIIGDVSGKGMPAALYAVRLQGLFELLTKANASPKEMLVKINEVIAQRLEKNYFITAVVAIFDTKEGKLSLARAGHNPPLQLKAKTQELAWLKPQGIGIGLNKNSSFDFELVEKSVPFLDGDLFVFYTDGITEARNGQKNEFGEKRLAKVVKEYADLSCVDLRDKLVWELNGFAPQSMLLDDDATFVIVKISE